MSTAYQTISNPDIPDTHLFNQVTTGSMAGDRELALEVFKQAIEEGNEVVSVARVNLAFGKTDKHGNPDKNARWGYNHKTTMETKLGKKLASGRSSGRAKVSSQPRVANMQETQMLPTVRKEPANDNVQNQVANHPANDKPEPRVPRHDKTRLTMQEQRTFDEIARDNDNVQDAKVQETWLDKLWRHVTVFDDARLWITIAVAAFVVSMYTLQVQNFELAFKESSQLWLRHALAFVVEVLGVLFLTLASKNFKKGLFAKAIIALIAATIIELSAASFTVYAHIVLNYDTWVSVIFGVLSLGLFIVWLNVTDFSVSEEVLAERDLQERAKKIAAARERMILESNMTKENKEVAIASGDNRQIALDVAKAYNNKQDAKLLSSATSPDNWVQINLQNEE